MDIDFEQISQCYVGKIRLCKLAFICWDILNFVIDKWGRKNANWETEGV